MDKAIERVIDSRRFVIVTSGNVNDFANMCGRFMVGDHPEFEDWWYGLPSGERYMAILSSDDIEDADEVFDVENGHVGFKKL